MHVNEDVLEMIEALILRVIGHIYNCLKDGDDQARHVHFVRVDVWTIKIVRDNKSCLTGVRGQTSIWVITRKVKLRYHSIK